MDSIPEELVDDIATFVSPTDLYNWLQTSKRYYRIVTPHLYKDLVFKNGPEGRDLKTIQLSKALKMDTFPSLLNKIRTCDIEFRYSEASKDMHTVIALAPNLEKFCARYEEKKFPGDWVGRRKRYWEMVQLDWVIPRAHEFINLKSIELYYPPTTIHRMSPIFRMPFLETFKIHGALTERDLYPNELPAWKGIISTIKHLYMSPFKYLTWYGEPYGDWIGPPIRQIISCCPHLETFHLSDVGGLFNRRWCPVQLVECLKKLPLRKLTLYHLPCCSSEGGRQPSIHEHLMHHNLEELEINNFLCRDAVLNDTVLLPSTLQVLCLHGSKLLQKTKPTTMRRELPALKRIVLREPNPHHYTAEEDMERLIASYKAAGIPLTREFVQYPY